MDQEKIIQELIEISKAKGYLAVKEILKFVSDDSEEFDLICAVLERKQVDVVSEDDMVNYKLPEGVDEKVVESLEEDLDESIILDLDFTKDIEEELLHDKSFENSISIKVDDPVRMYLKEIGRVDLLEGSREVELAQDILNAKIAKEQFDEMVAEGADISPEYKLQIEQLMFKGELAKKQTCRSELTFSCINRQTLCRSWNAIP
jgi:RNA polymerase primary sigma factor